MAHRISKKPLRQTNQQQHEQESEQSNYIQQPLQQTSSQNNLPRPIIPSVENVYVHDKSSHKNNKLGFPPAESLFVSQNTYDAGPDFLRPTSAYTLGNVKKSQFPFGVWVMPFGSNKVHKVRVNTPLRCTRCRAYVNAYFKFDGAKTTAVCNICGINFQILSTQADNESIQNSEIATEGVIDFVVKDKSFMKKRTDIVKVLIAIEIHNFLIESNAFTTIIESAKAAIEGTEFEKNIRIGVIVFNGEGVTYLKLNKSSNWNERFPKRYTVKHSAQGLCCPLSDKEMLFDPSTEKDKLLYLFDCVQKIAEEQHKNNKYISQGANYALVLKSLMQGFEQEIGRVMIFAHTVPKSGPMGIRPRNEEDNKNPMKPLTLDYYELSKELVKARIGVDMYIITKESLSTQELATTHFLSSHTGGRLHYYSSFNPEMHSENLYYYVYGALTRKYVYDVNFTARFSNGLNVSSFGIGDGIHETRDITLGMFDSENSVIVTYEQEEKENIEKFRIEENSAAFVQFAMIFTNGDGERIIRVINYRFTITNKIEAIHEGCDYLAVANILLRQTVWKMTKGDPVKLREELINKLVSIIFEYAQECGNRIKNSSFYEHPNLSLAFACIHTYINSKTILNHLKIPSDFKIVEALKINNGGFLSFGNTIYPKLYSLGMEIYEANPVPGDLIEGEDDIESSVVIPPNLPLTSESIKKNGVYLVWASDSLTIFIEPEVESDLLFEIFNTDDLSEIEEMTALPELESSHNVRISMILEELRRRTTRTNGIFLPLQIKTMNKKVYLNEFVSCVLKEDYQECRFYSFMDLLNREVRSRLK